MTEQMYLCELNIKTEMIKYLKICTISYHTKNVIIELAIKNPIILLDREGVDGIKRIARVCEVV